MTDPKRMPERIYAWAPSRDEGHWGDDPCFVEEQDAVEYIRADLAGGVDVMEGGEQAEGSRTHEGPSDVSGSGTDATSPPATPDPHEFVRCALCGNVMAGGMTSDTPCGSCGRKSLIPHSDDDDPYPPADDPIHEVNDESLSDRNRSSDRAVSVLGDPEATGDAGERLNDAVTVGPGDEVTLADSVVAVGTVIGEHNGLLVALWDDGEYHDDRYEDLRTPDGKPVSGFANGDAKSYKQVFKAWEAAEERIAELERELSAERDDHQETAGIMRRMRQRLERERDEAQEEAAQQARLNGMGSEREAKLIAERDEARAERRRWEQAAQHFDRKATEYRDKYQNFTGQWVRLDDDAIERIVDAWYNWPPHSGAQLRTVLRDFREGKMDNA